MKFVKILLVALTVSLVCACGKSGLVPDKKYGFKYPTVCQGGKAVWWEMHENRICAEPEFRESDGGNCHIWSYSAKLDLRNCGYMAINDYFSQLFAAGYDYDPEMKGKKMEDFLNQNGQHIVAYLFQGEEPFQFWGSTMYRKAYHITLTANTSDGSISKEGDYPSLVIKYEYKEWTAE